MFLQGRRRLASVRVVVMRRRRADLLCRARWVVLASSRARGPPVKAIVWLFVLVLAGTSAQAAPPDSTARTAFEDGRTAYNLGRWQEAIDAFEKAYRLSKDPALLYNIAQAHRQAGHLGEAITIYRAFL